MQENGYDFYNPQGSFLEEDLSAYTVKTFAWMFAGLLVTFGVAITGYVTGLIWYVFMIPWFHIVLLVSELAVVLILSARIQRLQVTTARGLFFAYAVLNGLVFSAYFLIYEMASLVLVFLLTGLYFGAMAAYGHFTKTDLSRLRPILIGGLIFLIVFGVASLLLPLGSMERVVCLAGIAIFMGFTAYDTQKIRAYYTCYQGDPQMLSRASIFSALQLYLDFINLFLYLLRFLGKKK